MYNMFSQANSILYRKFKSPKSKRLKSILLNPVTGKILFLTTIKTGDFVAFSQIIIFLIYTETKEPDMVVHACDPTTLEAGTGDLPVAG